MKKIAKWVVILWSILSLIGICVGIISVAPQMAEMQNDFELAGGTIGMACGLGIWLVIWLAIAGPALVIYLVSGKNQ